MGGAAGPPPPLKGRRVVQALGDGGAGWRVDITATGRDAPGFRRGEAEPRSALKGEVADSA